MSPTVSGNTVTIDVKAKTVITVFGTATDVTPQYVNAELFKVADGKNISKDSENFEGKGESLEIQEGDGPKTITWGPYDEATKVVLKFDHWVEHSATDDTTSTIRTDKMKEYSDSTLKTDISLIPASNEKTATDVHVVVNVTRMALLSN